MGYYKAGKFWNDETLWKVAETKTSVEVDVREYLWEDLNWNMSKLKDIAYEIALIKKADLSYPIILDTDGKVLDGCHRIVKAYLDGIYKIKAVTIDVDNDLPKPDYDEWEAVQKSRGKTQTDS